ncbi:MAG TPA: hypothetical protein VGO11_16285 [Chthoniobacteraceae bacterium]|jgi:hypothetical protein|nr:hypothetical protein [Chthoniobacteraceae bacterium]
MTTLFGEVIATTDFLVVIGGNAPHGPVKLVFTENQPADIEGQRVSFRGEFADENFVVRKSATHERIAERAFTLSLASPFASAEENWLRAEDELLS